MKPDPKLVEQLVEIITHEVLAAIKTDPALRAIPVVVLTSSAAEADEKRAYELEANGYVTKPSDLDDFLRLVRIIDGFCAGMVADRPA